MTSVIQTLLGELDEKVEALEKLPYPQVRDQVFEVLRLVDRVHRPGLEAVAARLRETGHFDDLLTEESVAILFALYDLAPVDEHVRAEIALEAVRPYLRSHGGEVEVLEIENGAVHVRLRGSCGSCAASAQTLRHGVEAALREGFEGFRELVVHDPEPVATSPTGPLTDTPADADLIQLRAPTFDDLLALDELSEGVPTALPYGERELLLLRAGGEVHAYDARCPSCHAPLVEGALSGHVLVCPAENCAYDVRSGRRVDGAGETGLGVYPVAVKDGRVLIAAGLRPVARLRATAS